LAEDAITEVLYYKAYHALLLGKPEFSQHYEMLQRQYQLYPQSFRSLTKSDILRIKKMKDAYNTKNFNLFEGIPIPQYSDVVVSCGEKGHKNHRQLCKEIYLNRATVLEPYTGVLDEVQTEYPVIYGSIDLLGQRGKTVYIIEVKTDTADHAIVGQVTKYYIGLSLQLHLKHFNDIGIITLCPGYDSFVYNQLKQMNAIPLLLDSQIIRLS
jgi:RecB family endonuclease NucS